MIKREMEVKMSLEELRNLIDEIDDSMIQLLERRLELVDAIKEEKRLMNMAIEDVNREKLILNRVNERILNHRHAEAVVSIYKAIFDESKKLQK